MAATYDSYEKTLEAVSHVLETEPGLRYIYMATQSVPGCVEALRRAGRSVYRIEVVHGYHRGTDLKDMVRRVYGHHPKVLRLEVGLNPGATELVLREY